MVDINADIIPGIGAAGLLLGRRYSIPEFGSIVRWNKSNGPLEQAISSQDSWLLVNMADLSSAGMQGYALHYHHGVVELRFNPKEILCSVSVFSGYAGKYAGDITVDDKLSRVLQHTSLFFDSDDELHYPREGNRVRGIAFLANSVSLEDDPDQLIKGIVIFRQDLQ